MTRGELAIIAATVLVVLAVFLWIAVDKLEGIEPGGDSAQPPTSLAFAPAGVCVVAGDSALATGYEPKSEGGPGGLLAKNRTGRATRGGVSGAASARLPRADAKLDQARLVCSFPPVRQALDMLRLHESVNGTQMVGDGGLAQGWLNQHEGHWNDGCEVLGVSWKWPDDTRDLAKCEMVAVGYWMRYARAYLAAGNVEELVRRFRLPFAPYRADNDAYWAKVKGAGR